MTELEKIGRRIALLRADKGYSQNELAERADISRIYISKIENGKVEFSVTVLCKLARGLEVESSALLGF